MDRIFPYILEIYHAISKLDLVASTPKERKLKISAGLRCLEDKKEESLKQKEKKE